MNFFEFFHEVHGVSLPSKNPQVASASEEADLGFLKIWGDDVLTIVTSKMPFLGRKKRRAPICKW